MTLDELPAWARELVNTAPVARLGLLDERDRPRVLPVTFAVFDDALWTAIDRKPKSSAEPARVRRLRRHPEATLLVDAYFDDWSRLGPAGRSENRQADHGAEEELCQRRVGRRDGEREH